MFASEARLGGRTARSRIRIGGKVHGAEFLTGYLSLREGPLPLAADFRIGNNGALQMCESALGVRADELLDIR
jgi:hypothetical protein